MAKGVRLIVTLLALVPAARAEADDAPPSTHEAPSADALDEVSLEDISPEEVTLDEVSPQGVSLEDASIDMTASESAAPAALDLTLDPSASEPSGAAPSEARPAVSLSASRLTPLTGDHLRYGKLWLIPRGILSGIGIPASITTWDAHDVTRFAAVTLTVTSLMLPAGPSADVRIQRALHDVRSPGLDSLFPKIYTIPMTIGLGVYTTALSAGFFFFKRPKLREYVSLMLEALGITQFYHVALKLMIGREGPYQGSREGHVHGPGRVSFPGGTPSGHAASAFAVLVTAAEYYGGWPLKVVCYLASVYLATSFFYNNQHFLSDVIWGAAIGDTVAKWVVRHRSSDARPSKRKTKVMFSPVAFPGGGGLRLSLSGGSFM